MRYYWDNKDLRKDVKALEKMYKEETNSAIKEEIAHYLVEAKACILEEETSILDADNDASYLESLTNIVPVFKVYYPYINEYRKKLNCYVNKITSLELDEKETKTLYLKKDEIMELVNELYKSIGGYIYENFSAIYNNRYRNTRYVKGTLDFASMIFIPGVNKPYMTLEEPRKDTYRNNLQTAVHEFGHGISSQINPKRYYGDNTFFREIETTFFELVANDFFSKELKDNSFFEDEQERLIANHSISEDILLNKKLIDIRYQLENPSKEQLAQILNDELLKSMLDEIAVNSFEDDVKYLFSHIVAIELYEVYKKDKDMALEMLKEILTRKEKESEYQNITRIVTPNKSLIKFKNYISKKIKSN